MKNISHEELVLRACSIALAIKTKHGEYVQLWPVPRGGIPVAYLLMQYLPKAQIIEKIDRIKYDNIIVIDDVLDSGTTAMRYKTQGLPFYALYDKQKEQLNDWLIFPWEGNGMNSIKDNITRILQYIGEDPKREGLVETPKRIVNSWSELYSGYHKNAKDYFKTFAVKFNELVLLKDVELYSTCEHHMLPFTGRAHIAYIADGKVIGVSKLARILEVYSRRLQVQERIGAQVVDDLMKYLKPKGAACIIEAKHHCMCSRGVNKQHSVMVTSAMRGVFMTNTAARAELLRLIK